MSTLASFASFVHPTMPLVVIAFGIVHLWRGLRGQPSGEGGLARRHTSLLGRLEGFRLVLLALTLIGLGVGWLVESRLLIFLALGFGIVELRESSTIINAFRFSPRPKTSARRQASSVVVTR
ncbi:MAG: hypothetical protein M3464_04290 [Chloroflexota bacterium]|nr:hypothetical protein [Chloroflexota bacterium]